MHNYRTDEDHSKDFSANLSIDHTQDIGKIQKDLEELKKLMRQQDGDA